MRMLERAVVDAEPRVASECKLACKPPAGGVVSEDADWCCDGIDVCGSELRDAVLWLKLA